VLTALSLLFNLQDTAGIFC